MMPTLWCSTFFALDSVKLYIYSYYSNSSLYLCNPIQIFQTTKIKRQMAHSQINHISFEPESLQSLIMSSECKVLMKIFAALKLNCMRLAEGEHNLIS